MEVISNSFAASYFQEIVTRLTEQLDVKKIILFGSYATRRQTKDSDIDILVIADMKEKGVRRYALVSRILEPRKLPLDIIVKTPAEMRQRRKYFDPFLKNIQAHGQVLYEKKA